MYMLFCRVQPVTRRDRPIPPPPQSQQTVSAAVDDAVYEITEQVSHKHALYLVTSVVPVNYK